MRKAYNLKKLTGQVRSFAALMLITLLAVGNAFAEQLTVVFSNQGYANEQVLTEGSFNDFISFTGAKNEASSAPKYFENGGALRFYAYASNGNGASMTLIPLTGYEITGLTITATGASNAPTIGVEIDGGTRTFYEAEDAVYTLEGLHAASSLMFINAASVNKQLRITSMTITYDVAAAPAVAAPVFSPVSGNYYTPQAVSLTCETAGANIYYSINGGAEVLYSEPFTVSATATVTAYAVLGEETSSEVAANYVFPVFLNNIAAFYAAENADLFKITGDVTFVYRNGRYMYVKDETGGLLVYDNYNPIITTEYNEGDVISGGLIGTSTTYNGLVELVPVENTAEGVAGESVVPTVVTAAELLANPANYVSQLVMVVDGELAAGSFNTNSATNINFTQDGNTLVVRNAFKTVQASYAAGTPATVIGFVTIYNTTVQLFPRNNADIITGELPVVASFDDASAYAWTLVNGDNTNKWYIGKAQGFDNNKLYISSSNGLTNKYNVSATSTVHAYKQVNLPNSDVLLTFNVRSVGDANDYLQITIMDEAPVAGVIPDNSLTRIFNVSEFSGKSVLIPSTYAGEKYVVFTWHNNNTGGNQQPAAIDNIVMYTTCTQVSNISATVNDRTAVVTWDAPEGQDAWTLEYKDATGDAWQTVNATTPSVTLNNLSTEVTYDVRVRANCGNNGVSAWANSQFYVPCIELTLGPVEMTIGTGTSTTNAAPANAYYKNSWTQMVYPASEFATAGYINAISWYVNASLTHNYDYFKIYIGTKADPINNSTSDWVSMDDLTLVYESYNGSLGSNAGWETYTLNTPYYYNGEDNLVIVTARTAQDYNSVQYRYTSATNTVLYRRSDSSPESYGNHPGSATGTRAAYLPNMKIDYTGLICGDAHCVAPADLTVNNITTTGAVLNWEAGDATAWQVNFKKQDADEWTSVNVTENTYTMTNLDQNTDYVVRVKADCGSIGMSTEVSAAFTTAADCQAPTYLDVEHHTANTVVTWVGVPGVTAYEVQYAEAGTNLWNTTVVNNVTTFIVNGLTEGVSYDVRVRTICGEGEYSDWVATTFTRPAYCSAPTTISTTNVSYNAATLTWNAGEGTSWTVEYGEAGFTLGEGTQVTTTTNTVTLTGLNEQTAYNIYIKANCGGYYAEWSNVYSFTTDCAPLTVTESNPWFEDFESYTGSGERPFQCWLTPVKPNGPFVYCGYAQSCHSGYNSAEFKGSVNVLVLPAFTNDIHTLSLSFWATATTTSLGQVEVGVLTDINDMNSFEVVATAGTPGARGTSSSVAGNGNFMGPFSFSNVNAAGGRIALRYTSTNSTASWNLDDFTVYIPQSCPAPAAIAASDVTTEGATISWMPGGDENAWELQYDVTGFNIGMGTTVNVTEPTYTLTGLNAETSYDVYVKSLCGDSDESVWVGPYTFETASNCTAQCQYTLEMNDSYGDGWNGGAITVSQNDNVIGTFSVESGYSATETLSLCDNMAVHFSITPGSYPSEMSFKLINPNGITSFNAPAGSISSSTGTLEGMTDCNAEPFVCTNTCTYTLELEDSYGDGWNGGALLVTQPNYLEQSYTISSGSAETFTVELCSGLEATFAYTTGSYANENSFVVKDQDGTVIWSHNGDDGSASQTIMPDCGGDEPDVCQKSCDYTFVLTDDYGDGWSGSSYGTVIGSVDVIQNEEVVATLTLDEGSSATYMVNLCDSTATTITVHPDYWASEMGMTVYDPEGNVVWEFDGSDLDDYGSAPDQTFEFNTDCGDAVACVLPTNLVVTGVTGTTATLAWTGDPAVTYEVSYKTSTSDLWLTETVTGTTVTLTDLLTDNTYFARVRATCDVEFTFTDEVMFYPTVSTIACGTHTFGSQSRSEYYMPVSNYYNNSYTQQIYTPEEVGTGVINKISFNYAHTSAMTKKNTVEIYLGHTDKATFASTSDWVTTGLQLVYTGSLNCTQQGWNEFVLDQTFDYNGSDNLVVAVKDNSGAYDGSAYKFYQTNVTGYQALSWQNDGTTWTSQTGTRRNFKPDIAFGICGPAEDLALTAIYNIPNACELSGIDVTIDVTNVGDTSLTAFDAYYNVNGGAVVHETVTLAEPLAVGEQYTYTFDTKVTMTEPTNVLTAWVATVGDRDITNNILSTDPILVIEAQEVPFIETFNAGEMNDGWFTRDLNEDNITFNIANGLATYTYNDELNANDWLMTSCLYVPAGRYDVSYTYNAIDPTMTENFGVYYGKKVGDDYLMNNVIATHEFSNTNYVTVHNTIQVAESGVYYFGIHAASIAGNAGFNINDFSIVPTIHFTAYAADHGTVIPEGSVEVAQGTPYTLTIVPDFGYHVQAIYKNMVQVMGENQNNASIQYYTFTPNNGDNIYVTFIPNKYEVNATVNNYYVTDYNNNAIGATYAPEHQTVSHGGSHTGIITVADNYHIDYVTVNGMEVTSDLVDLGNSQYSLTLNNIYEDKDVYVLVALDSTTITYTVEAGQGTINNTFVVDATTPVPATYTVTLPGYSSLLSTITPAPGYHVSSIIIDGVEHTNIESYSFDHLFGTHTVDVTFTPNHYVITTAGYGNGTVSAGAEFDYNPDYVYVFTATPEAGYRIGTITRNNAALTVSDPDATYTETLTMSGILNLETVNHEVMYEVMFVQNYYNITSSCGANGMISPMGLTSYLYHQDAVYNITANQGYYIASVTVDGVTTDYTQADALTSTTYTFNDIETAHVISATFAQMMFEVTVNAGANGAITPATASYAYGATPTFTIVPNAGYSIADVTVDGTSISAVATYTFLPLTAAHTIAATFTANAYTITATAGNGGTISPAGASTVAYNGDKTYTISANTGYHVSDVFVDGVSVGAVTTYTFTGVTANHTIYAAFENNQYTVTVNQPNNGTITPGTTTVLYGATPSFVITPAMGYNVTAITVNGTNVNLNNIPNVNGTYTYTFAAINANQTITATMTAKTYTITATSGAGGSIAPNGTTTVTFGGSQAYTFTPSTGYVISQVMVDGMSVGAPSSYVFTNVVANHTINVTFKLAECEAPISLYTTHIDSTSAMLHWSHPTATTFNIQYKNPTSNFTTIANVSGNSYQLTGLTPGSTYLWQVQAICAGNNHSDWANMVSFQTDNTTIDETGIEDLVKNNIKVYAEHQNVHILNNEGMNIDNVRIFDAYGKLIYSGAVNTAHEVINLNVAAGTYVVNVATDKGVANYKVVLMK